MRHIHQGSVALAAALLLGATAWGEDADDSKFLLDAMRTNIGEVHMAELAQKRAESGEVQDYADRLKQDHTRSLQEAAALANMLGVEIPTAPHSEALAHYKNLERLAGREFDAGFVSQMIAGHKEAIEKFSAQAQANPNREIAALAAKTLPMLREHLAIAESLQAGEAHHSHSDPQLRPEPEPRETPPVR